MTNTQEKPAMATPSYGPDIALVVLFLLGLMGWLFLLPILLQIIGEWSHYPRLGDGGYGIAALLFFLFPLSLVLLLASGILCCFATHLPKPVRALAVISPLLGLVACLLLFARLMTH